MFDILAPFAEFEADLIGMRTREGWRSPRPRGSYAASSRSSSLTQEERLVALYNAGERTTDELASEFGVAGRRFRAVKRAGLASEFSVGSKS